MRLLLGGNLSVSEVTGQQAQCPHACQRQHGHATEQVQFQPDCHGIWICGVKIAPRTMPRWGKVVRKHWNTKPHVKA